MNSKVKKALTAIVGASGVSDALMDLVSCSYDFSEIGHRPEVAVWPVTTRQVSEVVALGCREKIPIVPRGAGTGATGMAVPVKGGLVLDFLRMNRILKIAVEDRLAVVQPGVVYGDLQKALASSGFFFPPDPASGKVATLGGNVATNAGGLKGAKYGTTRDYVLGLEVVLPDGRITRTGSRCMKSASGYDLTKLFVGSEGTLGVFTEITLKIAPRPTAVSTGMASFGELEQAGQAVGEIMESGILPSTCELLDKNTIQLLIDRAGLDLMPSEAMLLVETDGCTLEETDFQMEKILSIFERYGAVNIRKAKSAEEAEDLWKARRSIGSILGSAMPNFLVEDVTVPVSKLTLLIRGIEDIARENQVLMVNFGHAGDGNLHPHFLYDAKNREEAKKVEKATAALFHLTCELGGTLSGEHGIGLVKAPFMALEHDPASMEVMRSLKRLLDPNNILNPGKMGL